MCWSRSSTGETKWIWCASHDRRPGEGPGRSRAAVARTDPAHPRYGRAVQRGLRAAHQEGAGAARQDHRQPVLRSLDPHPHLVRVRGKTALRRHRQRGGERQRRPKRRDAGRYGPQPGSDADRHGGDPPSLFRRRRIPRQPDPLQRSERGRRQARAPDPGAARPAHDPRQARQDRGPESLPRGRRAALPRRALQHLGPLEARRRSGRVRSRYAHASRHRRSGRVPLPPHRGGDRVGRRAQRAAAAARAHGDGLHSERAGVLPRVRGHARAPRESAARADHHAPGPHEPRRRDRLARRRWAPQRDPRPGDERRRRSDGGAVPARRRASRARRRGQARDGMMQPLLLKGGRVIDPSRGFDQPADVLIQDGKIAAVKAGLGAPDGAEVRDVRGQVVAPGLVDLHVHLREPGNEDVETIATGARAAAAGGFSAVCAMPNTDPVTDNQAAVGFIVRQSTLAGLTRVYPIGAISVGQKGEQLSEFGEMVGAGAVAVSDDGKPVVSSHLMRTALEYARTFEIPVADHCEEPTLAAGGVMHEGLVAARLGLKGIPAAAEEIMVGRDVLLAGLTGGHVHLCHVSTRGSVGLIRSAKEQGVRVTAEVTPHHLTLTERDCERYDTHAKMNPPLREAADIAALRQALKEGVIDCIASDHAPHAYDAKEAAFDDAPFGIVGLETAFAVAYTELGAGGILTLPELVHRMSTAPAAAFRLPGGTLKPGAAADVVVLDVAARWTVDPTAFLSKSRNTPFSGRALAGRAALTLVGGKVAHQAEAPAGS